MALLCTRRTSSCSKAFRSCSSLEAVRTLSTALGRIAPEAGEAGEARVRGLPSACPTGVETCRQIEVLGELGAQSEAVVRTGAAATLDRNSQNPEEAAVSIIWVRGRGRTCAEPAATRIGGGGRLATSSVASRSASSQVDGTTGFLVLRASLCTIVSSSTLDAVGTLVTNRRTAGAEETAILLENYRKDGCHLRHSRCNCHCNYSFAAPSWVFHIIIAPDRVKEPFCRARCQSEALFYY